MSFAMQNPRILFVFDSVVKPESVEGAFQKTFFKYIFVDGRHKGIYDY